MNYLPLPLHNKSKSITFINSPKLWFQNFLSYLETNNKPLYNTIKDCAVIIKAIIYIIILIFIGYFIGYTCFNTDKLKTESVIDKYVILTVLGISLCLFIIVIFNMFAWFTIFIIDFSLQSYDTIIELVASLRAYNSIENKDGDGNV